MSSLEFEPPKYARIVVELRRRIAEAQEGYTPGSMMPSETQLVREFAVGRTTVVRALQMLQHDGWIEREHGRGSFVKGRPPAERTSSRPGLAVLDQSETGTGITVVQVGQQAPPNPVSAVLGTSGKLVQRRWLSERDGLVSELVTCWFPPDLAYGTDLADASPLPAGVRAHLRTVKKLRPDHIAERLTARLPEAEEAKLLQIKKSEPVLTILATVHDAADSPLFAVEVVMPGSLHELEDTYSVTS